MRVGKGKRKGKFWTNSGGGDTREEDSAGVARKRKNPIMEINLCAVWQQEVKAENEVDGYIINKEESGGDDDMVALFGWEVNINQVISG